MPHSVKHWGAQQISYQVYGQVKRSSYDAEPVIIERSMLIIA